ncbi:MAG: hypothetical protein HQK50_05725 [Oligoflexia bacterium]|nr:hypothetical protein [Oligoflexia bacterium]
MFLVRYQVSILLCYLFCITTLVYAVSLSAPFVFADVINVLENPYLKDFSAFIAKVLSGHQERGTLASAYDLHNRVLVSLSYYLNYQFSGYNPALFRLTNICFHFLSTIFLLLFINRLLTVSSVFKEKERYGILWIVVTIFALHPMHVHAVTYISKRSSVMATMFIYASLWSFAYAKHLRDPRYWIACVCFVLAMGCKEFAIVLPLILVSFIHLFGINGQKVTWIEKGRFLVPFGILTLAILMVRYFQNGEITYVHDKGFLRFSEIIPYASSQVLVIAIYIGKIFFPIYTYLYYPLGAHASPYGLQLWSGFLLLIGLAGTTYYVSKKNPHKKVIFFSIVMFFLLLMPTSSFIPQNSLMVECRVYSCSAFLFLSLLLILKEYVRDRLWRILLLSIYLVGMLMLNLEVQEKYKHPYRLWEDVVQDFAHAGNVKKKALYGSYLNLGAAYLQEGAKSLALDSFQEAHKIMPERGEALLNIKYVLMLQKNGDK